MSGRQVVQGGTGVALQASEGDLLRIEDVSGKQVGDLVLFRADDPNDRFSQAKTRKLENTIHLRTGSTLWSTTCRPLARIERDTVERHDILSSACSPYDYPIRFGVRGHRSCLANLCAALAPFGIAQPLIPDPMNVFMNQELSERGTFSVVEPTSRAGDALELRMMAACIVGLSACPQDQNPCNGFEITDLAIEVVPA